VRRLRSEDFADKVIVTTIQKLGLALDDNSKRNKQRSSNGQPTYKEQLTGLKDKRIVFIFDECHRSQFGDNHRAIKAFFPRAQLFGFTGTPIFEVNASLQKIENTQASMRTTADLFEKQLHAYTITHAIEDRNVLRFHVDYFKPKLEAEGTPPGPEKRYRNGPSLRPSWPSMTPPPPVAASMRSSPPPRSMTPSSITACSRPCRRKRSAAIWASNR